MSHDFIKGLQEAAITFLGTVPARSIRRPNDEEEDDDINIEIGKVDDAQFDTGQSGAQTGELVNPDEAEEGQDTYRTLPGKEEPADGEKADGQSDEFDPELDPDLADEQGPEDLEGDANATRVEPEPQDPERMGDIRTVKGAHLVYKRQESDGSFKELWMYNVGEHINDAISIKRAILAGTDIPDGKLRSEDGKQMYQLVTMGNAQMLSIEGLSN